MDLKLFVKRSESDIKHENTGQRIAMRVRDIVFVKADIQYVYRLHLPGYWSGYVFLRILLHLKNSEQQGDKDISASALISIARSIMIYFMFYPIVLSSSLQSISMLNAFFRSHILTNLCVSTAQVHCPYVTIGNRVG